MPNKQVSKTLSTRDRILKTARHLFQRRGYYAVGTAEILAAAKAPKGSMYHHFPNGKEQIAIEAVANIHDDVLRLMEKFAADKLTVAECIRTLAKGMARWLKDSEWREGTMLASTTIGSVPDLPELHSAIKAAFDAWREHLVMQLIAEGWTRSPATTMTQTILAGIEGAMILARIDQDERVVISVADTLAKLVDTPEE